MGRTKQRRLRSVVVRPMTVTVTQAADDHKAKRSVSLQENQEGGRRDQPRCQEERRGRPRHGAPAHAVERQSSQGSPSRQASTHPEVQGRPPISQVDPWQGLLRTKYRSARRGDRPEWCPVCQRRVAQLRWHANARHLPWFADFRSACGICRRQMNWHRRREGHQEKHHPDQDGLLTPEDWWAHMFGFFRKLARALGVQGFGNLPAHARQLGAHMTQVPSLNSTEGSFFAESWCGNPHPFDPTALRDLRDCSYWRVLLRLVAAAPPTEALGLLVATDHPEEGTEFIEGSANSSLSRQASRGASNPRQENRKKTTQHQAPSHGSSPPPRRRRQRPVTSPARHQGPPRQRKKVRRSASHQTRQ